MSAALHEDALPTVLPLRVAVPRRCKGCARPHAVNADGLCAACDLRQAEAEACRSDLLRYDANEQLFGDARALLGRIAQMLEDAAARQATPPIRLEALRAAEATMRATVTALHRAGGV